LSRRERGRGESMRDRILDAAAVVLRQSGEPGATTREIARVAGCSEGSIYTYFASKEDLLLAVLTERLPPFIATLKALLERAGDESVGEHLEEVARLAIPFYAEMAPLATAVMATPDLSESLRQQNYGPHRANDALAAYLRLEQRLGRIRSGASLEAATALLLGACLQRAMFRQFSGQTREAAEDERFVMDLVATVLQGLAPDE
jgi:AcrR family transcriptional regulator